MWRRCTVHLKQNWRSCCNGPSIWYGSMARSWPITTRSSLAPKPSVIGGDAVSLFNGADTVIPPYFEMQATINAVKPLAGYKANAYLIFDWQSDTDFKFAGIDISTNKLVIGHRDATGWVVDRTVNTTVKSGVDYLIMLKANGSTATAVMGTTTVSFTFAARIDALGISHGLNDGIVGIGGQNAAAQIDNVVVQKAPEPITVDVTADFSAISPASRLFNNATAPTGSWISGSDGRFAANTSSADLAAINLASVGPLPITPGAQLKIATTVKTSGLGGVVFDYQGPNYYKYAVLSADAKQLQIGHRAGNAWVTDASYAITLNSSTDYKLEVTLRGGLVNVAVNGAVVLSKLFAETTTMGGNGLISRKGASSGASSFDIVRISSDERDYAPATPLLQSAAPLNAEPARPVGAVPTESELAGLLAEAKRRWADAGLDAAALARIQAATVVLADLPGAELGQEVTGTVYVDRDAAGLGWFVDGTPADDAEFRFLQGEMTAVSGEASRRIDLLSVIVHELGHIAGLDHTESGLMAETLLAGTRVVPSGPSSPLRSPAVTSVSHQATGDPDIDWGAPLLGKLNDVAPKAVAADTTTADSTAHPASGTPASGNKANATQRRTGMRNAKRSLRDGRRRRFQRLRGGRG